MGGNPLALGFLILAFLLAGLTVLFMVLQRRMLRDQSREVNELLAEARRIAADERSDSGNAAD